MNLKKLAVIGSLAAVAAAASGYALAAYYYIDTIYYTDASYSEMAGEKIQYCNGKYELDGRVTVYARTVEKYNCAYPIP